MSKKVWFTILLIILLILLAIYIKCCQPEKPESIVGSVLRATMETASATGDSCLYLSVQNDTLNKLSHDSTKIFSVVEYYTMPLLKHRRYWIARSIGKLDSIITAMNLKYPRWKSMDVVVTSLDAPYQIKCEVTMELVEPDGSTYLLDEFTEPGVKVEPILVTTITDLAPFPDSCLYLTVSNYGVNLLSDINTTISAVSNVDLIPDDDPQLYRRHWIIKNKAPCDGKKLSEIRDALVGTAWTYLDIVATSHNPPYMIEAVPPDGNPPEVTIRFIGPEPNPSGISFNEWGELDETQIRTLKEL